MFVQTHTRLVTKPGVTPADGQVVWSTWSMLYHYKQIDDGWRSVSTITNILAGALRERKRRSRSLVKTWMAQVCYSRGEDDEEQNVLNQTGYRQCDNEVVVSRATLFSMVFRQPTVSSRIYLHVETQLAARDISSFARRSAVVQRSKAKRDDRRGRPVMRRYKNSSCKDFLQNSSFTLQLLLKQTALRHLSKSNIVLLIYSVHVFD